MDDWIYEVLQTGVYKNVGGFSLLCGILRSKNEGFKIVSNRSSMERGVDVVLAGDETVETLGYECQGLSNALFDDEWPKVKFGKKLLRELVETGVTDENEFIERCFDILS